MQYWIDGYNLLFRLTHLKGSLEEKRTKLILELNAFAKASDLSFTLLFDAAHREESLAGRSHYDALEIIYTSSQKTADAYIVEKLESVRRPSDVCVVSSDKGLTSQVRAIGGQTLSLSEFCLFLSKKRVKKRAVGLLECSDSPREIERLRKIFEDKLRNPKDFD